MLKKVFKKLKSIIPGKKKRGQGESDGPVEMKVISGNLDKNLKEFKRIFDRCDDVIFHEFKIGTKNPVRAFTLHFEGLVGKEDMNKLILNTLGFEISGTPLDEQVSISKVLDVVRNHGVPTPDIKISAQVLELTDYALSGHALLFIDGQREAFAIGAQGWETRSVEEPETETVVRGPREGFTENLRTNISLVRRKLKTSRLKMETMKVGLLTKTEVAVLYIEGIANDKVVEEAKKRLGRINTDIILESGYIEEFIQDDWFSPFPQLLNTERPDRAVAALAEGQVVIVTDNTPFVLMLPATFFHFLQTPEDYYSRFPIATAIRFLRFVAINMALLLPSLYIAIVTYHQEMLPTPLLINIARAREGVPFPAFLEALLMETTFEILREAGVRLPRPVGQAVSIVGALVIGEAAVTAGLVSPAMVIVVSLTAIASFTIPNYSAAISLRILRFPLMALAASLGLFGIMAGLLGILIHLCSLRSFGVPYISPIAPMSMRDLKDVIIRVPLWAMFTRPRLIGYKEPARMDYRRMPRPPRDEEKELVKDGD